MGQHYHHLSAFERNFLSSSLNKGHNLRAIASGLARACSTLSREMRRSFRQSALYDAAAGAEGCRARRRRGFVKLREGTALRTHVFGCIRQGWSPQQISGKLRQMNNSNQLDHALQTISHETIYRAIYVLPLGEVRKELISLLRQAQARSPPWRKRQERRAYRQVSIHEKPDFVETGR